MYIDTPAPVLQSCNKILEVFTFGGSYTPCTVFAQQIPAMQTMKKSYIFSYYFLMHHGAMLGSKRLQQSPHCIWFIDCATPSITSQSSALIFLMKKTLGNKYAWVLKSAPFSFSICPETTITFNSTTPKKPPGLWSLNSSCGFDFVFRSEARAQNTTSHRQVEGSWSNSWQLW